MTGKREQQKADRCRRIIEAAEQLFRHQGYEDTKIEVIAREAGVSVGTVYNYFETKSDIVMTLVTRHAEFVDAEIEEIISRPTSKPGEDICGFFYAMTNHSLQHLGKENWRILYGLSIAQPQSQLGAKFAHFNGQLRSRVIDMLGSFLRRGLLMEHCDTHQLGSILFQIEAMHYIDLVSEDSLSFDDYRKRLHASVHFVIAPYTREVNQCNQATSCTGSSDSA